MPPPSSQVAGGNSAEGDASSSTRDRAGVGAGRRRCRDRPTRGRRSSARGRVVPGCVRVDPEPVAVPAVTAAAPRPAGRSAPPQAVAVQMGRRARPSRAIRFRVRDVLGLVVELVLELDADDADRGPAPSRQPAPSWPNQVSTSGEVGRVVGAVPHRRRLHPVGEPAVAHLAVAPGTDAQHDVEAHLPAHRSTNAATSRSPSKRRLASRGCVVDPEDVGRHDRHAARLHQPESVAPLIARNPAVVHLARDGHRPSPVDEDATIRQPVALVGILDVAHPGRDLIAGPRAGAQAYRVRRGGGAHRRLLDRRLAVGATGKHSE